MITYLELEQVIEFYVKGLIYLSKYQYPYHNLKHTENVVNHATFLIQHYGLNEKESFIVKASAWFHDTGHAYGVLDGHEQASVMIMQDFFKNRSVDPVLIKLIGNNILATRVPTRPNNQMEMILCDSDTWHLATPAFKETDEQVKCEMEMRLGKPITNWIQETRNFLEHHQYYTDYCRKHLEKGKQDNIRWLNSLA